MPRHRASIKAEQDELRERMRTLGLGYCEIAGEFARRYRLRPRAAWRVAYGWTLKQAADHINAHAADAGLDSGGTASMTGPHLCEYEQWPGLGTVPTGRKPTPYILALLAAVYGADSYQLLDLDDYAHLPAADRLVLDKHTRTPAQQHALPVGDPGGGGARISGSAAAFRTSQGATAPPRASRGPEPPATSGAITYGHLSGLRPLGPDVTPAYGDGKTWTGLPGRSDPADGSAHGALTVAMDDIGVIRNMLAALTTSDRQFGGGHARAYAADYLHAVVWPRLHARCDDAVRHELIVVATEFMLRVASLDLDGGHTQASAHAARDRVRPGPREQRPSTERLGARPLGRTEDPREGPGSGTGLHACRSRAGAPGATSGPGVHPYEIRPRIVHDRRAHRDAAFPG